MFQFFYALPIPVAVATLFVLFLLWTLIHLLAEKTRLWHWMSTGFVLIWVVVILAATILGRSVGIRELRFLPLQPLLLGTYNNPEYFRTLLMNLLLFIPLGIGLTSALPTGWTVDRRIRWAILLGFALSLLIELVQLIFSLGYAEVDDLLTNTLGTALGGCQLYLGKLLYRRKNTK